MNAIEKLSARQEIDPFYPVIHALQNDRVRESANQAMASLESLSFEQAEAVLLLLSYAIKVSSIVGR